MKIINKNKIMMMVVTMIATLAINPSMRNSWGTIGEPKIPKHLTK